MGKLLKNETAAWVHAQKGKSPVQNPTRLQRTPIRSGGSSVIPQWQCRVVEGKLRVSSGALAWGGCHYTVWPSGAVVKRSVSKEFDLALEVGDVRAVVWFTKSPPVALYNCPTDPNGDNVSESESECCTPGDPGAFTPDRGTVQIMEIGFARPEGWTDFRYLATIERTESGFRIAQIQHAEIAVNAIVYPGEKGTPGGGGDDDDDNCGDDDFPSDIEDDDDANDDEKFPSDIEPDAPGGDAEKEDEEQFPSKTGQCW